MIAKRFVLTVFILGLLALHMKWNAQKRDKPQIVWFMTEDVSPEFDFYNYSYVNTPNLDRLAAQCLSFTRLFSTAPVCSPRRSAMITGMHQTSVGVQNHRSHPNDEFQLPQRVKLITEYLWQAGYFVYNGQMNTESIKGPGKTDYNSKTDMPPFDGYDWKQRRDGQPFFAVMQTGVTHNGLIWKTDVQMNQPQINPDVLELLPFYPSHPVVRKDMATYLGIHSADGCQRGSYFETIRKIRITERYTYCFFE